MKQQDFKKLEGNLVLREKNILARLSEIAKENPAVEGDFKVRMQNIGSSEEDNAQEQAAFERDFALKEQLEKELREIQRALEKIRTGTYGTCDSCSSNILQRRLEVMPIANFCVSCAQKRRI